MANTMKLSKRGLGSLINNITNKIILILLASLIFKFYENQDNIRFANKKRCKFYPGRRQSSDSGG